MRPVTVNAWSPRRPVVPIWMGELSSGTLATSPTFDRSTSWRTTTERQKAQTACTDPDHENVTGAPQFGQRPSTAGMDARSIPVSWRGASALRVEGRTEVPPHEGVLRGDAATGPSHVLLSFQYTA